MGGAARLGPASRVTEQSRQPPRLPNHRRSVQTSQQDARPATGRQKGTRVQRAAEAAAGPGTR